ncbi:hypothetical protein AcW1_007593 [Taiwanofungus camphoratus]|nr:hypothetical protein AcW2_007348 [Antrodia cinnamomea]KAI0947349.1 hypothetical protein AcV7_009797 [Antrodia cinnamomea]KAI0953353.1 hypothetical protein AcW1_007593 [Antrodia cinnamomea]
MFFKFTFVAAAAALLAAVHASPLKISPVEDDVYSPPITSPSVFSVWTVGSNQTVTWNTASIPSENQNSTGLLLLGYQEDNNEHLDIRSPLATGFPIASGSVNVVVPNVTTRSDYIVVLFGDSGNASPQFTINA